MDYEKKYNDALNLAKSYYGNGSNEFLDTMFPELRESEDERIRKAIIHYILYETNGTISEATEHTWVKWLEKQKDSVSNPKYIQDVADAFEDGRRKGEQKEQKPPIAGNDFGWIDELKHDLKHPEELDEKVDDVLKQRKGIRTLEWSEEDERMLSRCIKSVECSKQFADSESYKAAKDVEMNWLKSLPERFNLQPKQEWSEEDEKMLNEVLDRVTYAFYDQGKEGEIEDDPAFLWLHRLRPSWKPSEEQMAALHTAAYLEEMQFYGGLKDKLRDLYEQLKKL